MQSKSDVQRTLTRNGLTLRIRGRTMAVRANVVWSSQGALVASGIHEHEARFQNKRKLG
jgi:hypothetical protein